MSEENNLFNKYLELNWPIIPTEKQGKKALVAWKEYNEDNDKVPDKPTILAWYSKYDNADWSLLTGHNNLVLVDCDDPNLYDNYLKSTFNKCVMRTPSGGVSFLVESVKIPTSSTKFNNLALDIRGLRGLAKLPTEPYTEEDEAKQLEFDQGTKVEIKRHWISFHKPEKVSDIISILEEKLPKIVPEGKAEGGKSAIDYAQEHMKIEYKGHGYVQTFCILPNCSDSSGSTPSMAIYEDGAHCFHCGRSVGLFSLIKHHLNISDEEVSERFPGVKKDKTMNDRIISLILDNAKLVRDLNNNTFLLLNNYDELGFNLIPIDGEITWSYIVDLCERHMDKKPSMQALNYVVRYLKGKAGREGERIKVFRRVGGDSKTVWFDLGDREANFVKITEDSFSVLPKSDVVFMRETNQGYIPFPNECKKENVKKLFNAINIKDKGDQLLIITWLVNSLLPFSQYPVVLLHGVKGSGKSETAKLIKRIIDPTLGNDSDLSVNKRDPDYIVFLCAHNACAVLDNISHIDRETSDILCQTVTGAVLPTRKLYTTNDTVFIDIKSRMIITAINKEIFDPGAGDLGERTVAIELNRPEGKYMSLEYITKTFEDVRADVLGGLFALVQGFLKVNRLTMNDPSDFRMTTFAKVGQYIAREVNFGVRFGDAYKKNQLAMSQEALDAEPISKFVIWFANEYPEGVDDSGEGRGIEVSTLFNKYYKSWEDANRKGDFSDRWPKTQRGLSSKIRRIEPDLKTIYGIHIKRTDKSTRSYINIYKPSEQREVFIQNDEEEEKNTYIEEDIEKIEIPSEEEEETW